MRVPGRNPFMEVPVVDGSSDSRDHGHHGKDAEKNAHAAPYPADSNNVHVEAGEAFTSGAQAGVLKMEAMTTAWTRKSLIVAYIFLWIVTFVDNLQQGTSGNLNQHITSHFESHSLTGYIGAVGYIVAGVVKLPLAKYLDICGRPQGFLLMVFTLVFGLVLMAVCNTVHAYAAAQIFYWIGYNGLSYVLSIFICDTSSLRNRGFMLSYLFSPYIITAWLAGPLAKLIQKTGSWRWFYGAFSLITLVVALPLYGLFQWNYRKSVRAGIIVPTKNTRTFYENVKFYLIEFDAAGLSLLMGGLLLFFLPFNIQSLQAGGWKSPLVISFFVIGTLMLIGFVLYERFIAPKSFLPYDLLTDRTVLGAIFLSAILFVSWYIWHAYFFSFLRVVNALSIEEANYITLIYTVGSCVFSVVVGIAIRWSGRYKWIALYFGVPFMVLGVGLMIQVRQPDAHLGLIILCQIFVAFAGGACVLTEQIAAMAATDHQYVAVVLALEGMFSLIGGGIGSSIATAIWIEVFPGALAKHLPAESQADLKRIYGSLDVQLTYPKGSATRIGISRAYADAQKWMLVTGTGLAVLGFPAVMFWRDIRVRDFKQTKGRVA